MTGTRQFTYRESIDLLLQNEHLSTNGTALPQQEVTIPKYSVRLYDKGRPALRKHYGTGGGAGLEHCVEFGYDQHTGRLAEVTHGGGGLPEAGFDYTYLQNSHLPEKLISPVHTAERVYESYRDALKSMVNEDKAGTPNNLATVTYGGTTTGADAVNAIGQRESVTFTGDAYSAVSRLGYYEYGYNPNGELVAGQRRDDSDDPMTGEGFGYDYDPIGNRLEASVDGSPVAEYTPNSHNQYEEIDSTTRVHDVDGNLTDDGTLLYTWDAENRLVQVNLKSDNTLISKYRYDYRGRRVYKRVFSTATGGTAGETAFVYEGWNLAVEYPASSAVVSGTAAPVRAYTWGNDLSGTVQGAGGVGGLLAIDQRSGGSPKIYYPLYDGNGNVTQLVKDGTGTEIVAHYEYDPFGNLTTSPTEQDRDSSGYHAVNPFRFSSKYFDAESGLYYYGYRHYDPMTGRWLSRDPTGEAGDANLLCYVGNSTPNWIDFLGLDPKLLTGQSFSDEISWSDGDGPRHTSPVKYRVEVYDDCSIKVIVEIRLRTRGQIANTWDLIDENETKTRGERIKDVFKEQVNKAWNGKFKLCCTSAGCKKKCPNGLSISVELKFSNVGIEVRLHNTPGGDASSHIKDWDVSESGVAAHEIGHFLGNTEEYGNVEDIKMRNGRPPGEGGPKPGNFGAPKEGGGLMNNRDEAAEARHFWHIANSVGNMGLGKDCKVVPNDAKCE